MARRKRITGAIPRQAGRVRVEIHPDGLHEFLRKNKSMRDEMMREANKVKAEAQRTASSAEEGPGGRIDGYAAAGFEVQWETRNKVPRVNIVSLAEQKTFLAAHFHTIKRDGVAHMRAALKVVTGK